MHSVHHTVMQEYFYVTFYTMLLLKRLLLHVVSAWGHACAAANVGSGLGLLLRQLAMYIPS